MSDSSEEEDMSRFKEAVDNSFTASIHVSKHQRQDDKDVSNIKSERYLDTASHYNDVKVPKDLQKQIAAKISALINNKIEFVNVEESQKKKRKIKGGVKLFKDSAEYLNCEAAPDTYTQTHNQQSKKVKWKRRQVDANEEELDEYEKINVSTVTGDYVISKEETKCWKSRRKEKLFKYKSQGKSKVLISID